MDKKLVDIKEIEIREVVESFLDVHGIKDSFKVVVGFSTEAGDVSTHIMITRELGGHAVYRRTFLSDATIDTLSKTLTASFNTVEDIQDAIRSKIFQEIMGEREYQEQRWGTEFDDKNTLNDWVTYITRYSSQAAFCGNDKSEQRSRLLKASALCVAALESFDKNNGFPPRHYDEG